MVFPLSFHRHLARIYNLRIFYTAEEIYLWDDEVSSAFRWIKLHPDVSGLFGFVVPPFLFVPTGQTFGSNTSPSNWEPLARARTAIGENILKQPKPVLETLKIKHITYLEKLKETLPRTTVAITPAHPGILNLGVYHNGTQQVTKMNMHVDDNLMADILRFIKDAIVSSIESNFRILGSPNPAIRKSSMEEDKFVEIALSSLREHLGVELDSRKLTVSIIRVKCAKISKILTQFGPHRRGFFIREIAELIGTLNFLTTCSTWSQFSFIRIQEFLITSYKGIYHNLKQNPKLTHLFPAR